MTYLVCFSIHSNGHGLSGKLLEGPRTPKQVHREGYAFTFDTAHAWRFPNEKQAAAKARIVARHLRIEQARLEVISHEN